MGLSGTRPKLSKLMDSLPSLRELLPDEEAINEARAIIAGRVIVEEMKGATRETELRRALDLLAGRDAD